MATKGSAGGSGTKRTSGGGGGGGQNRFRNNALGTALKGAGVQIDKRKPCLHCKRPLNVKYQAVNGTPHGYLHTTCERDVERDTRYYSSALQFGMTYSEHAAQLQTYEGKTDWDKRVDAVNKRLCAEALVAERPVLEGVPEDVLVKAPADGEA